MYAMSAFKVPHKICEELDAKVRKFWWKPRENKSRFLALKAWDHICQPKQCAGLGFGRFKDLNTALLSKIGWQFVSCPDKLYVKLLRAKYGRVEDWLRDIHVKNASWVWREL